MVSKIPFILSVLFLLASCAQIVTGAVEDTLGISPPSLSIDIEIPSDYQFGYSNEIYYYEATADDIFLYSSIIDSISYLSLTNYSKGELITQASEYIEVLLTIDNGTNFIIRLLSETNVLRFSISKKNSNIIHYYLNLK